MRQNNLPTLAQIINDAVPVSARQNQLNILLNQNPPQSWVKQHPFAKKVKYIPIDKIEYLLTKIFVDWYPEIKEIKLIGNSVNCIVRLHYRNPVDGEMRWVDGVGACPVQTDAGEKASDFDKIKNDAIMKASPAAKSYAIKDAAECIGRIFGKDLNRPDLIGYETLEDEERFKGATITEK